MQKSIRFIALAATLTFAVVPAVRAEQLGTNPHPQVTSPARGGWSGLLTAFRSYFGM